MSKLIRRGKEEGQFVATLRSTITTSGSYLGANSREIHIPNKKQNKKRNLNNILFWTIFGKEKTRVNKFGLVAVFEVEWNVPCHNILVEFLNNNKLDFEHNKLKS